jgi:hypothetical protein
MIDPGDESLSVSRQCEFAGLSRSTFYFRPRGDSLENLRLMKVIDRYHMDHPAFGSRQIAHEFGISRGRARRLMRNKGISARSSFSADQHPSGGACDLPLFAPQCCNHGSESCLVNRHNVHPHGLWLRLFDGGD